MTLISKNILTENEIYSIRARVKELSISVTDSCTESDLTAYDNLKIIDELELYHTLITSSLANIKRQKRSKFQLMS